MSKASYPKEFPCPTCGRLCDVALTKKAKPYYMCEMCGVQVFIRAESGIKKFSEFKTSELLKDLKGKHSLEVAEIIRIKEQIELIETEIKQLEAEKPVFIGSDKYENKIIKLKKARLELKDEYFQHLAI